MLWWETERLLWNFSLAGVEIVICLGNIPSDRLETVVPRVGKRLTLLLVKGDMLMQLAEQLFFYYIIITRISLH
jgi:hypothetical protein